MTRWPAGSEQRGSHNNMTETNKNINTEKNHQGKQAYRSPTNLKIDPARTGQSKRPYTKIVVQGKSNPEIFVDGRKEGKCMNDASSILLADTFLTDLRGPCVNGDLYTPRQPTFEKKNFRWILRLCIIKRVIRMVCSGLKSWRKSNGGFLPRVQPPPTPLPC